ncbi:MAG TPA: protein kinase, partial [Anaerolineae bacterium]|nr:protein kinase [Anaerolineae bacterium]
MKVKIWGARGSIPSPVRPDEIREKIISALLSISQIEQGEFREELLAAILEEPQSPQDAAGQSVNLAAAKTLVKRRQVVRAYLDSLPPLTAGTAGGNTPCIEIQAGDDLFIIDAGSGIRGLGLELMKGKWGQGEGVIHLFFSHPHWDHIQGFPFFRPAFVRGNKIFIYSVHDMEAALRRQQEFISFPVSLDYMQAEMEFIRLKTDETLEFGDLEIRTMRNRHPGDAYAFRFEKGGKAFVYASDAAYPSGVDLHPYLNFFADADVLIYDSQFTQKESDEKEDWGHSSSLAGVEMAQEANVKNLVLFHYDPTYTDKDLEKILEDTRRFQQSQYPSAEPVNIMIAQEGQTFDLTPPKTTQLQQVPGGQAAILKPAGIFNERVAAELKKQLAELKQNDWPPHLIIDMSGVEMLQVAGLRALVKLRREQLGAPMVLAGPSINVQQVIELAGYLDFFAIYPSVHAALNALQARETLNLPGQTIKNRYYIEAKIGDGRLGTVFKATDTRLNRTVAVKVLSASFSEGAIERFLQQGREIVKLTHPNIVDIYDCDEDQGLAYMAEEIVEGQSLPDLLNEHPGQALPLDLALTIAEKMGRALEYAHAHGVIHGDLKPKNVLIGDEIKISDFGLGR